SSVSRSQAHTCAPRSAKACVTARPMPRAAPATMTRRFANSTCIAATPAVRAWLSPRALRPGAGSPRGRCLKQADGSSALLLPRSGLYICATIVRIERHLPSGTMINPLRLLAVSFLALSVLGLAGSAVAQERRVPSSAAELTLSYAPVVQRVAPAVVNVYAAN